MYAIRSYYDLPRTLRAANRFLGLDIPEDRIDEIVTSDGRHDDAKRAGQRFSTERRKQAYAKVEDFYGDELDKGLLWMVNNNPGTQLKPRLSGALS